MLVAAYRHDISAHLALAKEYGYGLEIQAFSQPDILDGDWRGLLEKYRVQLKGFSGPLACHGAFFDMSVASEDQHIIELTRQRYLLNLEIAQELGARHVVFHTNFLPMIRTELYRRQYIERQVVFWQQMGYEAQRHNVWIVLENMWDPDPFIIQKIMESLSAPHIGVCLDISHVYLYNNAHPLKQWLDVLGPYIIHVHMNNTRGVIDEHLALNIPGGALDYAKIIPHLANFPRNPWLVLELDDIGALTQSLKFIQRTLSLLESKKSLRL